MGSRITLVWIGGAEHPGLAASPPGADGIEDDLRIDIKAAPVIFGHSNIAIWQVPRNTYRQMLMSCAELMTEVSPRGRSAATSPTQSSAGF